MTYCPPPSRGGNCYACWAAAFRDLGDLTKGGRGTQIWCSEARRTVTVTGDRKPVPPEWCPFNATNARCRRMVADYVGGEEHECSGVIVPRRPRGGRWDDVPYLYSDTWCDRCGARQRIGSMHAANRRAEDECPARRRT